MSKKAQDTKALTLAEIRREDRERVIKLPPARELTDVVIKDVGTHGCERRDLRIDKIVGTHLVHGRGETPELSEIAFADFARKFATALGKGDTKSVEMGSGGYYHLCTILQQIGTFTDPHLALQTVRHMSATLAKVLPDKSKLRTQMLKVGGGLDPRVQNDLHPATAQIAEATGWSVTNQTNWAITYQKVFAGKTAQVTFGRKHDKYTATGGPRKKRA